MEVISVSTQGSIEILTRPDDNRLKSNSVMVRFTDAEGYSLAHKTLTQSQALDLAGRLTDTVRENLRGAVVRQISQAIANVRTDAGEG